MKVLKGFLTFFCVIISIVICLSSLATIFLWTADNALSADSIKNILSSMNISEILNGGMQKTPTELAGDFSSVKLNTSTDLEDALSGIDFSNIETFEDLSRVLNETVQAFEESGVDVTGIYEVIENDVLGEVIGTYVEGLEEYLINGETDKVLDSEKLIEVFNNAKDSINEIIPGVISEEIWNDISDVWQAATTELVENIPTYENIKEEASQAMQGNNIAIDSDTLFKAVGFVMSGHAALIFAIIIVILAGFIALFRFSPYRWLCWTGIPMLIAGGITLLPVIAGAVLSGISFEGATLNVGLIISNVTGTMLMPSLTFVILGILFIVAYIIINVLVNKAKNAKQIKNI